MKKKTHEEYVDEVFINNPNIEVIGKYINTNTKIAHRCLKHNVIWDTTPARILQGIGCEMCRREKFRQIRCKTHEEYVVDVKTNNPNVEVVEKYIDAKTPILHRCVIHNIEWKTYPDSILKGCGCVECWKEKIGNQTRKNHKDYVNELSLKNPNIIVLDVYIDSNTPILHKCLKDGYEWYVRPSNILSGKGCPKCSGNIKRSHEEYIKEVSLINSNVEVLESYVNMNTPILHKCKIHNIEWLTSPSNILQGCGCVECGKEKISAHHSKTHEQYVNELKEANPNIFVIEKYNGANTSILHKCLIDGCEWMATPANILWGTGCPQCHKSKGEKEVQKWLNKYNIVYETQYKFDECKDIRMLPFDFYLPTYNVCIEYQGKQHYYPIEYFGGQEYFEYIQKHDNIKKEYCKNNGILLLCIPYFKDAKEELNNFLFI